MRNNYLNDTRLEPYFTFINECKNKIYDIPTHKHHIIPISMSEYYIGDNINDMNNKLILSCQDHFQAHWILANCFPIGHHYHMSNLRACGLLFDWATNPEEVSKRISESRKGLCFKTPAQLLQQSEMMQGNKFNLGNKHTEETKKTIAEKCKLSARKRFPICENVYKIEDSDKYYRYCPLCNNIIINKNYTYARLGYINKSKCNSCAQIGVSKKQDKTKPRKVVIDTSKIGKYNKFGKNNPNAKSVMNTKTTEIFNTMKDAADSENITIDVLRRLIIEDKYRMIIA